MGIFFSCFCYISYNINTSFWAIGSSDPLAEPKQGADRAANQYQDAGLLGGRVGLRHFMLCMKRQVILQRLCCEVVWSVHPVAEHQLGFPLRNFA